MIEWFKNLSTAEKIGIVVPVGSAVIAGLCGLLIKWLLGKKGGPESKVKTIHQEGEDNTAANIDGDKNIIAGRDVKTGIYRKEAVEGLSRRVPCPPAGLPRTVRQ